MVDNQEWLEVSLTVNGELAEAVSDVLTRYVPTGVVTEKIILADSDRKPDIAIDSIRICAYLPVDDNLLETRKSIEQALWHLSTIQPLPEINYQTIQKQNWMDKWKENYHPITVGEKLLILPPWIENPQPERIPIRIAPGMAFGTGTHPTTRLCLKLIDKQFKPDTDVIDIGCGSGILSIACHLLGAHHVLSVDTDPLSIQAAHENSVLNNIQEGIEIGQGSVREIIHKDFTIHQASLVLVNIIASVIFSLLEQGLSELVMPGGILITSGILQHQADEVNDAIIARKFLPEVKEQLEDWVALSFIKQQ